MFKRKPKLTPQEHARALELVLGELDADERRGAATLLARMDDKDRDRTERLMIRHGAAGWRRAEEIMLRFGQLAPAPGEQADVDSPAAQDQHAAPAAGLSDDEQREQANRALGR